MSNSTINFFSEEIDFTLKDSNTIETWINQVSKNHKRDIENINYVFCSDEYLLEVNKEHLNHNYFTDIITFDMSDNENIESDIFISIDRVRDNAIKSNSSFEKELHRVLIHGLLHLIGFDDKTEEQKVIMREKEDSSLSLLKF